MKDIFLMGAAGSGKDTVAYQLWNHYYYEKFSLADPIRKEYNRFFPNKNPRTDRDKMIEIGQIYKKLYSEDVWVKQIWDSIIEFKDDCRGVNNVIIVDGRYSVEYDFFVRQKGFIPVRVVCPDSIRLERLLARDGTAQEQALKKESTDLVNAEAYEIDNSQGLDSLVKQLENFMKKIRER